MGSKRLNDLNVVIAITCVAMCLAILDLSVPVIRAVVGVPFALILPGYAVLAAVFPYPTLRRTERVLGSIAMSMAVATLGGFVLNLIPWGLRPQTWALFLGAITLTAVSVAYRRRGVAMEIVRAHTVPIRVTPMQGALFGLAIVVLVAAAGVAYTGAVQAPTPGFTQLWLLPGDSGQVRAGFRNEEGKRVSYTLRVQADNVPVRDWPNVTLNTDETWEMQFPLAAHGGEPQHVEALLYRTTENGIVYRRATLER